ncbi:MAG: hypothetical protein DMF56_27195 [Acidobacteria bacterium]|nr:MAG: hypothetical protein DMF56_27195 [Acidobacteriota bacterium]
MDSGAGEAGRADRAGQPASRAYHLAPEHHRRNGTERRQVERRQPYRPSPESSGPDRSPEPPEPPDIEAFNRRFEDTLKLVAGGNDLLEVTYRCLRLAADLNRIYRTKGQPYQLADFPLDDPVIHTLRQQADNLEVFLKMQIEAITQESQRHEDHEKRKGREERKGRGAR